MVFQVGLFGLKFYTPSRQIRWVDFDVPLKKQLEKSVDQPRTSSRGWTGGGGINSYPPAPQQPSLRQWSADAIELSIGVFYYVDRAYALQDSATR